MPDNPLAPRSVEQAAVDLIDRNVSFDFKAFLGKIGPAPSVVGRTTRTAECLRSKQERPGSGYVRETLTK
jgi:hypothetical protein